MKRQDIIPKEYCSELEYQEENRKLPFFATRRGQGISALLMIVVIAVILAMSMDGGVSVTSQLDSTKLGVVCGDRPAVFIPYEEVHTLELLDTFDLGKAVNAETWDAGWCGLYHSDTYGDYTVYAYSTAGKYIIVGYTDGVLVFNGTSASVTEAVFAKLQQRCGL